MARMQPVQFKHIQTRAKRKTRKRQDKRWEGWEAAAEHHLSPACKFNEGRNGSRRADDDLGAGAVLFSVRARWTVVVSACLVSFFVLCLFMWNVVFIWRSEIYFLKIENRVTELTTAFVQKYVRFGVSGKLKSHCKVIKWIKN